MQSRLSAATIKESTNKLLAVDLVMNQNSQKVASAGLL
jgi:hypothetical protein